jgi:hypothetical protein
MTVDTSGNVGIGNRLPIGTLCIGDSSVDNSDGNIVIGKRNAAGGTRHLKMGYNNDFDFVIGDFGNNNTAGTWLQQLKINYNAPANSLVIDTDGNITGKFKHNNDIWHQSADNKNRLFFGANDRTFFGSQNGYVWRNAANLDIMTMENSGQVYMTSVLNVANNLNGSGRITGLHYNCLSSTVQAEYKNSPAAFGCFISINSWWINRGQCNLHISINTFTYNGTELGRWTGTATLFKDGGILNFRADYNLDNNITLSNYWDNIGGNFIRVQNNKLIEGEIAAGYNAVYKIYG